jgi:hypothetical protein
MVLLDLDVVNGRRLARRPGRLEPGGPAVVAAEEVALGELLRRRPALPLDPERVLGGGPDRSPGGDQVVGPDLLVGADGLDRPASVLGGDGRAGEEAGELARLGDRTPAAHQPGRLGGVPLALLQKIIVFPVLIRKPSKQLPFEIVWMFLFINVFGELTPVFENQSLCPAPGEYQ